MSFEAPRAADAGPIRTEQQIGAESLSAPVFCAIWGSARRPLRRGRKWALVGATRATTMRPMNQFDSQRSPTRRTVLQAGLGAGALLAIRLLLCRGAARLRPVARQFSRPRAGKRHFGCDLDPGDGPHRARHVRVQADAEAAGVQRADLAIHQPPRLGLAHHQRPRGAEEERGAVRADRAGFWRRARHAAGAVGRRVRLWRSAGAAEPHAAGISLAGGACLERAAPQSLLGNRADQRAENRRPRLGHAGRNARLLGRRDGAHPMDAGSLAQCRHGL